MKRCSERLELLGNGQDFKGGQRQKEWNQIERGGIRPVTYAELNLGTPRARSASVGKSAGGL